MASKKKVTTQEVEKKKTKKKKRANDDLRFEKKCVIVQIVLIILVFIAKIYLVENNITDGPIYIFSDYGLWVILLIGLFPTIRK